MTSSKSEDQWIAIQHKTFVNWANDQLSLNNRSVENLATDFCDGVKLVALVEVLQFQKIGKVYSSPKGRIQALQNVSLALNAVQNDNVKLVNIGPDDVVGGNLKLILGLLWRLILRYQISASKTKAPPKKLMLSWFQDAVPEVNITDFTSSWNDGVALHALLEYCKPGLSPQWRSLNPKDNVNNCKVAMQIAKDHLGVPRVISPEDFASPDLDELSAMTYLSYFIKKSSPGYYGTLNWVCRQLKTANISNLTTDWNDGSHLCALVHSLGGDVPGWPDLNKSDHVATCQKGLDAAEALGVIPILTASELADPGVDHLAIMAYIGKLQRVVPRKGKAEKLSLDLKGVDKHMVNEKVCFSVCQADPDMVESKAQVQVVSPSGTPCPVDVQWVNKVATCCYTPTEQGFYKIHLKYDGVEIRDGPFDVSAVNDYARVKVTANPNPCSVATGFDVQVEIPFTVKQARAKLSNGIDGSTSEIFLDRNGSFHSTHFKPPVPGPWNVTAIVDDQEMAPITVGAYDASKARISGSQKAVVGQIISLKASTRNCGSDKLEVHVESDITDNETDATVKKDGPDHLIAFTPSHHCKYRVLASIHGDPISGSPFPVDVVDPGKVTVVGDGLTRGTCGMEAFFRVNAAGTDGTVHATVDVDNYQITVTREKLDENFYEFSYIPIKAGIYNVNVFWNDSPLKGSPFQVKVIDKTQVQLVGDYTELKDENDRVALIPGQSTTLNFDVTKAGPGTMKAEMLSPKGKIPLEVHQKADQASVTLTAELEGAHHIHVFWEELPLAMNPILAYCPGPPLPVDHTLVTLEGQGKEAARMTIPAEFVINGRKAGPGVPKVVLQGVSSKPAVEMKPIKYDRYRCRYAADAPGSYLLYVYWSDELVPGCPLKVNVTPKGDPRKVTVQAQNQLSGFIGQDLYVYVNTSLSGPGDVTATVEVESRSESCQILEHKPGEYVVYFCPTVADKHKVNIKYDGEHVTGSPFTVRISEPPDPEKVRVFGPGVEDGLLDRFESRFVVETFGAGSGQLSVKIKGPKGAFRVDMTRESQIDRNITCRYDPSEPGEYFIHVKWSGMHVPGSPFHVQLLNSHQELDEVLRGKGITPMAFGDLWRAEI